MDNLPTATSPDCEIHSRRAVSYPIELVFRAWTEPQHLARWWGPSGFTNSFHEFDLRPGGTWKFTMHGPDKGHYENECEFLRIEPPFLIAWKRRSKPLFHVVVRFAQEAADRTGISFRMIFDNETECNKVKRFAVEKNEENFDRLETVLHELARH